MKRFFALLLSLFLLAVYAQAADRVVGTIYHMDIAAKIDGAYIPSYNINGSTGVVAEDLAEYGFDVRWDGTARTLHIDSNEKCFSADYVPAANTYRVGSAAGKVYATDIKTYLDGEEVPAYNIGGATVILMDELSRLLHGMKMVDYEGITYAGNADKANLHMEVLVNGEPVFITMVRHMIGNGHSDFIFMLDSCHADVETFSVSCKP